MEQNFEAAMYNSPHSVGTEFDKDGFSYIFPEDCPYIDEWIKDVNNIRPYRIGGGETAFYQLILEINEVGRLFLILDDFINNTNFYEFDKHLLD